MKKKYDQQKCMVALSSRTTGFSTEDIINNGKCKNNHKIKRACSIEKLDQIKLSIHDIDSSILDAKYIASIADDNEYVNKIINSNKDLIPNIPGNTIIEPSHPAARFESTEEMILFCATVKLNLDIESNFSLKLDNFSRTSYNRFDKTPHS